jgi:hypothetical protein
VVIVSHDRDLLNRTVGSILHLDRGKLTLYRGGYDDFERLRREQQSLQAKLRSKQEEARMHMQAFVDRFRAQATKARQAQSRLKALEKMEPVPDLVEDRVAPFYFPSPARPLNPPLVRFENVAVGYGADTLLAYVEGYDFQAPATVPFRVLDDQQNVIYSDSLRFRGNRAVEETANLILLYNGRVANAYYHSASGGHTENNEYAFVSKAGKAGSPVGWARGKPDVDANGVAYDSKAASYYWQSAPFTMAQLSQIMTRNDRTNVGEIISLTFTRGVSGRIYRVDIVGTNGTKTTSGGVFKNTYNNYKFAPGNVKSTMYYLEPWTGQTDDDPEEDEPPDDDM